MGRHPEGLNRTEPSRRPPSLFHNLQGLRAHNVPMAHQTRQIYAQHYPPGKWYSPRALEMGLNPNSPLTVEIEFLDHGKERGEIWEVWKIGSVVFYRQPIIKPAIDADEEGEEAF